MSEQANPLHLLKDKEEGGGPAVRTQTPIQHAPDLLDRHQNRDGRYGIVLLGKCLSSSVSNTLLLLLLPRLALCRWLSSSPLPPPPPLSPFLSPPDSFASLSLVFLLFCLGLALFLVFLSLCFSLSCLSPLHQTKPKVKTMFMVAMILLLLLLLLLLAAVMSVHDITSFTAWMTKAEDACSYLAGPFLCMHTLFRLSTRCVILSLVMKNDSFRPRLSIPVNVIDISPPF